MSIFNIFLYDFVKRFKYLIGKTCRLVAWIKLKSSRNLIQLLISSNNRLKIGSRFGYPHGLKKLFRVKNISEKINKATNTQLMMFGARR